MKFVKMTIVFGKVEEMTPEQKVAFEAGEKVERPVEYVDVDLVVNVDHIVTVENSALHEGCSFIGTLNGVQVHARGNLQHWSEKLGAA